MIQPITKSIKLIPNIYIDKASDKEGDNKE